MCTAVSILCGLLVVIRARWLRLLLLVGPPTASSVISMLSPVIHDSNKTLAGTLQNKTSEICLALNHYGMNRHGYKLQSPRLWSRSKAEALLKSQSWSRNVYLPDKGPSPHCYRAHTLWTGVLLVLNSFIIDHVALAKQRDNALGSVSPPACLFVDMWHVGRPWPWLDWDCMSRS